MKKRLLITSIVMMLVVAVALSTATYAWFTSNTSVTASSITMTASTSSGSALGIGWIGQSYQPASDLITANAPKGGTGTYDPMVPEELYTAADAAAEANDDITAATPSTVQFNGGTIKSVGGNFVFNNDVAEKAPYTFNGTVSGTTYNAFYVRNLSTANDIPHLKLTLEWGPDTYVAATTYSASETYYTQSGQTYEEANPQPTSTSDITGGSYFTKVKRDDSLVRVGVFAKAAKSSVDANPDATPYNFIGVLGKTANLNTEWGVVEANGNVASLCAANEEVKTVTVIDFGQLDALNQIDLVVLVWLDGVALNDDTAGACSTIGLSFDAANS